MPSAAACTTNADCCSGLQCEIAPGALGGTSLLLNNDNIFNTFKSLIVLRDRSRVLKIVHEALTALPCTPVSAPIEN